MGGNKQANTDTITTTATTKDPNTDLLYKLRGSRCKMGGFGV